MSDTYRWLWEMRARRSLLGWRQHNLRICDKASPAAWDLDDWERAVEDPAVLLAVRAVKAFDRVEWGEA